MLELSRLRHGLQGIESRRGTSSHQSNPFVALSRNGASEDYGEVIGINLVYGGNFSISAECCQFNTTRVTAGINPFDFCYTLKKGESLESPEAVLVYSANGLGEMSRNFHNLYRQYLINPSFAYSPRPVLINKGLNPKKTYHIKELNLTLSAKTLMSVGLPLSAATHDFYATRFTLTALD